MSCFEQTPGCDLAIEAHEMLAAGSGGLDEIRGIKIEEVEHHGYITVTKVKVENDEGSQAIGKPVGNYITIEMPSRFYGQQEIYEQMCECCADEIKALTEKILKSEDDLVLVAGLGNHRITADALGPKAVAALMITRHLKKYVPDEIDEGVRPLCAIAPGVLGTTGMETEEIVRALTDKIQPKLVIVIDALCSGNLERINTTVQITDTGITPGGGVGNKRKTINTDVLGVPVIAIGVPTVVDAAAIAKAGIEIASHNNEYKNGGFSPKHARRSDENSDNDGGEIKSRIRAEVDERFGNLIVAPKDVDNITDDIASVIANGINISMHPGITFNDIDRYV